MNFNINAQNAILSTNNERHKRVIFTSAHFSIVTFRYCRFTLDTFRKVFALSEWRYRAFKSTQ